MINLYFFIINFYNNVAIEDAVLKESIKNDVIVDARVQQNMTQKELSTKTGITQADIESL